MPVDVYVLLDVLLLILIALFIPIGFWRGAYREGFVTLGILFGASMGTFWGESWGVELANATRLHESGGAFMIAMLCLIGSTFLLGYSAGAAVPVPDPGWIARSLGALVAAANGALLLSFALRDIRVYLLSSEDTGFLDNAVIAPFLSDGTGWILLVSAAVFVPIALVIALFGPEVEMGEYYDSGEFDIYDEPEYASFEQRGFRASPQMPVFAANAGVAGYGAAEETRPIQVYEQREEPAPEPSSPPATARRSEETTDEQDAVFGHHVADDSPDDEPDEPETVVCPVCQAEADSSEDQCPNCGATL